MEAKEEREVQGRAVGRALAYAIAQEIQKERKGAIAQYYRDMKRFRGD